MGFVVVPLAVLEVVVEEMEDCRLVPAEGSAGGPMDVLTPIDGRLFAARPPGGRALDGVPVREVAVLEGAVANCFVGDFVGDWDTHKRLTNRYERDGR